MIINIRGTSGSGKSTIVREIMGLYTESQPHFHEGRRQPLSYSCSSPPNGRGLEVIGHYETACGGCDTIKPMELIFDLVRERHDAGGDVLFEGLLISADVQRTRGLHLSGYPLRVIVLDTPVDLCLESINTRRRAKNPDATPVNPRNTVAKAKAVEGARKRLTEGLTQSEPPPGIQGKFWASSSSPKPDFAVLVTDRAGAVAAIKQELGL